MKKFKIDFKNNSENSSGNKPSPKQMVFYLKKSSVSVAEIGSGAEKKVKGTKKSALKAAFPYSDLFAFFISLYLLLNCLRFMSKPSFAFHHLKVDWYFKWIKSKLMKVKETEKKILAKFYNSHIKKKLFKIFRHK